MLRPVQIIFRRIKITTSIMPTIILVLFIYRVAAKIEGILVIQRSSLVFLFVLEQKFS